MVMILLLSSIIFANKMILDRSNIITIKEMVRDLVGYPIKFYIYKLNPSSVNKTSKMVNHTKYVSVSFLPVLNLPLLENLIFNIFFFLPS